MKILQILGTGCPKCRKLTELTEQAARELGIEYRLEKVTDIGEIVRMGAALTPALAIDGQVVLAGRVPHLDEIKHLLSRHRQIA